MSERDELTDEERVEAFETVSLILDTRQDTKTLPLALRNLVSLRNMAWLSERTGLNRTGLFRSLAIDSKPNLGTIEAVLRAFGLRLSVKPIRPE